MTVAQPTHPSMLSRRQLREVRGGCDPAHRRLLASHCKATSLPPPRAGQRTGGRGHRRSRSTGRQAASNPGQAPRRAAFNRAAKLNPYRRHRRQSASLPSPPHERASGQAGGAAGGSTGTQATRAHAPQRPCSSPVDGDLARSESGHQRCPAPSPVTRTTHLLLRVIFALMTRLPDHFLAHLLASQR